MTFLAWVFLLWALANLACAVVVLVLLEKALKGWRATLDAWKRNNDELDRFVESCRDA